MHAFTLPTDGPGGVEQDGPLEWDSTTMVLVVLEGGVLRPDPDRPGLGLTVRWSDVEPYRVWGPAAAGT